MLVCRGKDYGKVYIALFPYDVNIISGVLNFQEQLTLIQRLASQIPRDVRTMCVHVERIVISNI